MPVGVSIGARRPTEIAVAIAGELIALRARREHLVRAIDPSDVPILDEEEVPVGNPSVS
jgi:xanthine/CO dehydrogenase XdhC/CoxF family maturation factor